MLGSVFGGPFMHTGFLDPEAFMKSGAVQMATSEKRIYEANLSQFVIRLRSWLSKQIQTIKAISVPLLAVILIVLIRLLCLFVSRGEAPEIDLGEIER
jgi:hypothetical protein